MTKPNLIKQIKEKYKMSYREIAEATGIKESTLNSKASSKQPLTDTIKKPLELFIKAKELEEEQKSLDYFRVALNRFLNKQ